uniref:Cilia- and flagella-associated protein 57 n=1 Tax=Hemiselmis tepida TaxID=464990 RepID=A0A7S0VMW2_9CRYP|mmetsp:Transcript_21298/g.53662  ORF Transcript_21298/g.53662 Transcript_21298/m.53662 type:complete len:1185 (+) Transcript_21298:85-3639(+)
MSMAALLHRHLFGIKVDGREPIWYIDDQTVLYPAGHNTVIFNLEQRIQRFLPGTDKTEEITAIAVSPNKKFVAVAEKSDKGVITVFDLHSLKRRRLLTATDSLSKEFVSLAFSPDSKLLMAQGGAPDWSLTIWTWEKAKFVATIKTAASPNSAIYQCSFCPTDNNLICVTGNGVFKQLKLVDSNLKQLPNALNKREPQNYLCHTWLSEERVVMGTDTGDLLVVDSLELKAFIPRSPSDSNSIEAIVGFSKGIVTGSDDGSIAIYDKTDEKELYKRTKVFRIDNNAVKIRHLAVSHTEEQLVMATDNNQLYQFNLTNADIMKPDETNFDFLATSFHSGQITGVDTCVRKPLVATCGLDKSVRMWNYVDKTLELTKYFNEEAHSLALHPSGLHLLVGFSDKMRLLNVVMDDMRPFKEFAIKACRECKFSHGGHMFAAVNGNTINVFATYTCENLGNLRGHNGKVRSVCWSADDTKIVSCGMDGAVYEWNLKDFKRVGESVLKSCNYTCAVCTPDGKTSFAVGSDKKIKEITDSNIVKEYDLPGAVLCQVVLSHSGRMLFTATDTGSIQSWKFPLTNEVQDHQCHSRAVARMCMTHDDAHLFTVGEDGVLLMLDVRDKEIRAAKRDKELLPFSEEILVTKSDLEEKTALTTDLKLKVDELQLHNDYQLRLKDMNHQDKIKELTDKLTAEIEAEKARHEALLAEKNDMEMEYEERIKNMEERHLLSSQQMEAQYQHKIMAEVERYQQLLEEKELLNERWDEQNSLLVESHERLVQELTDEYEYKLQEEQLALQRVRDEKDDLLRELEETRRQVEEDADQEIEELKDKYEVKLSAEREQHLRLKGENGIMRKKFHAQLKEIEDGKDDNKQLMARQKELYHQISMLEKEIAGLKKEIRERDETIGDKEKRIYDLKKKNQELEKFKFVLDYKIKELKKQIEPRELEIADMKHQIKEMDQELERYHKTNSNLELTISDNKLKLEGQQQEILAQRGKCNDMGNKLKRYHNDLHAVIQYITEPKQLKEAVKALYQKHVQEPPQGAQVEQDIQKEYNRQRDYLEKTVESLKKKLSKDMDLHKTDSTRIMHENVALIKEINELRREIKALKQGGMRPPGGGATGKDTPASGRATSSRMGADPSKEIDMQREEIRRLRNRVDELEGVDRTRPTSREKLPPMEGFAEGPERIGTPGAP